MDEYHSDSEPELSPGELEKDRRRFTDRARVTDQQRKTVVHLTRHMMLITEQCPEHGPAMLKQLLCLLKPYFPGMARDPAIALKGVMESWDVVPIEMHGGEYWYRGLQAAIRANMANDTTKVKFDIHIDAAPLPQRTNPSLVTWTILGTLHEGTKPPGHPFLIAVYCGNSVPPCEIFLRDVCEEAERLCNFYDDNHAMLTIEPRAVKADGDARAYLKGTIHQHGLNGCTKCRIIGEFLPRFKLVSFDGIAAPRSHDDFIRGLYDVTHRLWGGPMTPLARMGIDLIRDVTVGDDRHLLHYGIAKTIFFGLIHGYGTMETLTSDKMVALERVAMEMRFPHERKPRQFLEHATRWRHAVWGNFFDIVGIVVMRHIMPQYALNYSKLHWAIAICSHRRYGHLLEYARRLLGEYVTEHKDMVGFVTCTFHYLLHLVDEVEFFGPIPLQSTYPEEEELAILKLRVNIEKTASPAQQVARSILLREAAGRCLDIVPNEFPKVTNDGLRVKIRKNFMLRDGPTEENASDSWFLVPGLLNHGTVVRFEKATKDPFAVFGYPLVQQRALHIHPIEVPIGLNVYHTDDKTNFQFPERYELSAVICKLCLVPLGNETAAFVPLPESFSEEAFP